MTIQSNTTNRNLKSIFSLRMIEMIAIILLILALTDCQSVGHVGVRRKSESATPKWTNHVPEPIDGFVNFVGVSSGTASENSALELARQDVVKQVMEYLGGFAQRDFEQRALSLHLESSTLDPSIAAKDFVSYANKNFVSQIATKESYWEYRITPSGYQYFAYVLIPFPINQSMSKFSDQQITDAQRRVQEAQTEDAKRQAKDVLEFWQETEAMSQAW